ncbi:MltR family transcriptional regulator [Mesorhizobium sp. YC-39]|uniref:MltR family transcriptional regulator n=1 Tax=unclassified Mesorhizobium TaxID=325217 RepID=UPI0021E9384B|nr:MULTISPECIES: MltR family transcriptional regulator [unclassified Mesorhizobium]MCV3205570.1 MltR family transcriptional regulator [Mesorhizobium sp. YC-2]MCV3228031.1 MltR family transcriptional regulator [Mesorhizobium sp. YC-39]
MSESEDFHAALNRLARLLRDEDERGLVLTMAAFAEDLLGRLIRGYLVEVKASGELLDGFNAPLGTLSSRIKGAYALGLLSKEQFADLEHLRKIRNEFAHKWEGCSYARKDIASRIAKMTPSRIPSDDDNKTPKHKLRTSISCVLTELDVLARLIRERHQRIRPLAMHLSLTPPKGSWPFS